MKRLFILATLLGMMALLPKKSDAQVSFQLSIGSGPAYCAPAPVYYEPAPVYCAPYRNVVYVGGRRWANRGYYGRGFYGRDRVVVKNYYRGERFRGYGRGYDRGGDWHGRGRGHGRGRW